MAIDSDPCYARIKEFFMVTEGYPLIAVVEDDTDLRSIYTALLEHSGFTVNGYTDGKSALEALQSGEVKPKLIVLDYMMPGLNGGQFLTQLSEQPNVERIPTIVVSALSSESPEVARLKAHPWVIASFTKIDVSNNKLVEYIKNYFGLN
jgi:CheY-like chemotaxis protein